MKLPSDIRLIFSPTHRLFFTFTPCDAKRVFDLDTTSPVFAYGSGQLNYDVVLDVEEVAHEIGAEPTSIRFVDITKFNYDEAISCSVQNGLYFENGMAHITTNDEEIAFVIDTEFQELATKLAEEHNRYRKLTL